MTLTNTRKERMEKNIDNAFSGKEEGIEFLKHNKLLIPFAAASFATGFYVGYNHFESPALILYMPICSVGGSLIGNINENIKKKRAYSDFKEALTKLKTSISITSTYCSLKEHNVEKIVALQKHNSKDFEMKYLNPEQLDEKLEDVKEKANDADLFFSDPDYILEKPKYFNNGSLIYGSVGMISSGAGGLLGILFGFA